MSDEMVYVTKAEMDGYLRRAKINRNVNIAMLFCLSFVIAAVSAQGAYFACIPSACVFCFLSYRLYIQFGIIKKITAIIYSKSLTHAIKLVPNGHVHDKKVLCTGTDLTSLKDDCYSDQLESVNCPKCLELLACNVCGAKVGEKCDAGLHG